MPRHLISDAHEWINEIPTVPAFSRCRSTRPPLPPASGTSGLAPPAFCSLQRRLLAKNVGAFRVAFLPLSRELPPLRPAFGTSGPTPPACLQRPGSVFSPKVWQSWDSWRIRASFPCSSSRRKGGVRGASYPGFLSLLPSLLPLSPRLPIIPSRAAAARVLLYRRLQGHPGLPRLRFAASGGAFSPKMWQSWVSGRIRASFPRCFPSAEPRAASSCCPGAPPPLRPAFGTSGPTPPASVQRPGSVFSPKARQSWGSGRVRASFPRCFASFG